MRGLSPRPRRSYSPLSQKGTPMKRKITLFIAFAAPWRPARRRRLRHLRHGARHVPQGPVGSAAVVSARSTTGGQRSASRARGWAASSSTARLARSLCGARRTRTASLGTCATYWPPLLTSGKVRAGHGAKASLLGSAGYSIYDGWTLKSWAPLVRGELVFENGALVEAAVSASPPASDLRMAGIAAAMSGRALGVQDFDAKEIK